MSAGRPLGQLVSRAFCECLILVLRTLGYLKSQVRHNRLCIHLIDMVGRCHAETHRGTPMTSLIKLATGAAFALLLVGCANSYRFGDNHDPRSYTKIRTAPLPPTAKTADAPIPPTHAAQQAKANKPKPRHADVAASEQPRRTVDHHEPSLSE